MPENPPNPQESLPAPEAQPASPLPAAPPPKKRGLAGRLVKWTLILGLLFLVLTGGGLGAGFWALGQWARRPFGQPGTQKLKIEPRTSSRQISRLLRQKGLVSHELLFMAWLKTQQVTRKTAFRLQAGDYQIQTPVSPTALVAAFSHGRFERALTIPEGWTVRQIAHRLAAEGWIKNEQQWFELVRRPVGAEVLGVALPGGAEGFCFPETYRFETGTKPEEILRRMLAMFKHEWAKADPSRRDPRSAGLSMAQVVVLASMIEREARTEEEMPMVASVYLNRIGRGMKMQCCATVRYALGEVWDRPLRYGDLKVNSPYNTYLHPGLPPGAIANPGRKAIEAVLRPAPSDYLFYVYANNGFHIFSRTYAEHLKAIRALRQKDPHATLTEQDPR